MSFKLTPPRSALDDLPQIVARRDGKIEQNSRLTREFQPIDTIRI
jgi:hypothetical protein